MKSGINPRYKAVGRATYHSLLLCVAFPIKIIYIHKEALVTTVTEKTHKGVKENVFFRWKSQVLKSEQQ